MDNIKNLRELEKVMDENRAEMQKINRLFSTVYAVCAFFSAVSVIAGLAYMTAIFLTLGMAELYMTPMMFFRWLVSLGSLFLFGLSHEKEKKFTYYAIDLTGFMCLVDMFTGVFPSFFLLQAVAQCACLPRYNRVEYLKGQMGYPEFNAALYASEVTNSGRLITDYEVKKQLSDNRENRQKTYMEEITAEDMENTEEETL